MSTEAPRNGFFSKERITAPPGFNRWMIPPAALAVHLCIGQAYAFSVFNGPMTRLIGIEQSAPDDWGLPALGWIFSLAILFLGLSAAFAGKWLEEVGPRKAMFVAACCFGGGFIVSSIGISTHQLWLLYLGYGVLGPVLVNYIRQYQVDHGVPPGQSYTVTMYLMAGLLVVGFICNLLVRPVAAHHHMAAETDTAPLGASLAHQK